MLLIRIELLRAALTVQAYSQYVKRRLGQILTFQDSLGLHNVLSSPA